MSKKILIMTMVMCIVSCITFSIPVYASDNDEYITILVDAVDENGELKYALDSDDPAAFGDSNEFVVPAGTSHTIYVKDAAGNITSQVYGSEYESVIQDGTRYDYEETSDGQTINIDLEIGGNKSSSVNGGIGSSSDNPVEPGSATVSSKTITDGSESAEKIFYTFTTKEGEVLYLIVDQGQNSDNVYLLDTVSIADLHALADGQTSSYSTSSDEKEDNLLSALAGESSNDQSDDLAEAKKSKTSSNSNAFIILILAAIGGGAYYYLKVYRNKKDEAMDVMDAMDIDEFEPEEEEEEIDFEIDDAEKDAYLQQLIDEEEELFDADPEEYATSHMAEDDFDTGIELDEDEDIIDFATVNDEEEDNE